jgi:hypothetical protein
MKTLDCYIVDTTPDNNRYVVKDGTKVITSGTSSSPSWVRNDAGGHHTKKEFDILYPEGWEVIFHF